MQQFNYKLEIDGVRIMLCSEFSIRQMDNTELFESCFSSDADAVISVRTVKTIATPNTPRAFSSSFTEAYPQGQKCLNIRKNPQTGEPFASFFEDMSTGGYILCVSEKALETEAAMSRILIYVCLPHLLLKKGRLMMHASFIKTHDVGGIVFAAASGGGKSTQAMLWEQYEAASTINGDRAVLWADEGASQASVGSLPFCGTSHICKRDDDRLSAIVVPCRANSDEARIERLYGAHAIRAIIENAVVENWREGETEAAAEVVCRLVERTPVYRLFCHIDKQAVDLLKKELSKG